MNKIEHEYNIVSLSETWANDNISDSELRVPGYSLYMKDGNILSVSSYLEFSITSPPVLISTHINPLIDVITQLKPLFSLPLTKYLTP